MIGLIGKKVGMTTIFEESGRALPVTILKAGPCEIIQVKTENKDGYSAVQLGFDPTSKKVSKPVLGHFKSAGTKVYKKLREFRIAKNETHNVGETITVSTFNIGDRVRVTGISKGKGFQGVRKRHNFKTLPKSHGASNKCNSPGSIGASSFPSKVNKGMRMAGHMGNAQVTTVGEIVGIDEENNLILVKGAVAGPRGAYITIRKR